MIHHAPLRLWREARQLLSELWSIFGAPTEMAQHGFYTRTDHGLLSQWLRGCEAVLRALLFMEAVELCVAGDVPPPSPRPSRARKPPQKPERDLNQPDTWRVRFRIFDPAPQTKHAAHKRKSPARLGPRVFLAWPLAQRAEACLRVFNNPERHVLRLARKLKANPRAGLAINTSSDDHKRVILPHIWDEVCGGVADATERLPDSS